MSLLVIAATTVLMTTSFRGVPVTQVVVDKDTCNKEIVRLYVEGRTGVQVDCTELPGTPVAPAAASKPEQPKKE